MANPTTYFGWVMPNSADLVTDLPADFAVFGQGVDTSMQDLLGGTTGQVLSKTSGTNMDFTWVTPSSGLSAASQAEMETASSTSVAVTPGRQQYHPSSSKAWIIFNGESTIATLASYNVTSITDNGTGNYTVTWNVDFSSINYAVVISAEKTADGPVSTSTVIVSATYAVYAGSIDIFSSTIAGNLKDSPRINVVAYGDQ